jgi:hypothetical protein
VRDAHSQQTGKAKVALLVIWVKFAIHFRERSANSLAFWCSSLARSTLFTACSVSDSRREEISTSSDNAPELEVAHSRAS